MTEPPAKTSKLLQRLQVAQSEKRFYEAHQICKTIYFRCTVRRNYAEALTYIVPGAKFLLQHQQWESGIDVACLAVELMSKGESKLDVDEHFNDLCALLRAMPSTCVDREKYISKTLSLLSTQPASRLASFNEFLGRQFWQEGSLTHARNRMILSGNGFTVGCFLIELHRRYGGVSEVDLFIVQAVLQFLCMKKESVAALTFFTYTRRHPKLDGGPPFTEFPLLNFVWLLMLSIHRKLSNDALSLLCTKYRPQLARDPNFSMYLERIGQLYFGLQPKQNSLSGMLSNLMKMFNEDEDEKDDDSGIAFPSTSMHVDEID